MTDKVEEEEEETTLFYFEGIEKNVEIEFSPLPSSPHQEEDSKKKDEGGRKLTPKNLRDVPRKVWDEVLEAGQCSILDHVSNEFFDSYILSESSMFVYPFRVIIKTCGRTIPLDCVPLLRKYAKDLLGLGVSAIDFRRKNYSFPKDQVGPHTSFEEELKKLKMVARPLVGDGVVVGDRNGEYWCTFSTKRKCVADETATHPGDPPPSTIHVIMYDIEPSRAACFVSNKENTNSSAAKELGLAALVSGSPAGDAEKRMSKNVQYHGFMFDPCGYSMNGLNGSDYFTVHITPESHCSYASFEARCSTSSRFASMTRFVTEKLRPKRFAVIVERSTAAKESETSTVIPGYVRVARTETSVRENSAVCSITRYLAGVGQGVSKRSE